ncbi:MAG: flavin reductase family protein [Eubacteriales bacterium]
MNGKVEWKPGNMLYPLPAVLVSSKSGDGRCDVCTVAWAGTVCTNPPMIGISLRPSRQTYEFISETDVFVVNVTTEEMTHAVDYCGVKSGKNENKFETAHLTPVPAAHVDCPMIGESPVSIECRVKEKLALGSHTLFIGEVVGVHVDASYVDAEGAFHFSDVKPIVYCHGEYRGIGKALGTFGYSVRKKKNKKENSDKRRDKKEDFSKRKDNSESSDNKTGFHGKERKRVVDKSSVNGDNIIRRIGRTGRKGTESGSLRNRRSGRGEARRG